MLGALRSRIALTVALGWITAGAPTVTATQAAAQPTTISFDEIVPEGGGLEFGSSFVTQGYTFGCLSADTGMPCTTLGTLGPLSPSYTGSAALFNNNVLGITTLARTDGGAFDLLSLRMAAFLNTPGGPERNGPVVFEGTLAGGGVVTETFVLPPYAPGGPLTTYTFSEAFRDLVSVRYRGRDFSPPLTFISPSVDDIVVRAAVPATVPEPSTAMLVAAGLLVTAGTALRRRRAARRRAARGHRPWRTGTHPVPPDRG